MPDPITDQSQNCPSPPAQNFSGMSGQIDDSFLRLLIEVEQDLTKFEMETLRRKRLLIDLKTKTKKWVAIADGVAPVCNELGISEILGLLRSRATVIGRLTKKTEEQIASDMFQFHRALIELFQLRADDWDLDEEMAKPLLESCIGIIEDIMYSCLNGFTAINVKSQYTRHENASSNDGQPQKNILGMRIK
jgi:hypothetical protein